MKMALLRSCRLARNIRNFMSQARLLLTLCVRRESRKIWKSFYTFNPNASISFGAENASVSRSQLLLDTLRVFQDNLLLTLISHAVPQKRTLLLLLLFLSMSWEYRESLRHSGVPYSSRRVPQLFSGKSMCSAVRSKFFLLKSGSSLQCGVGELLSIFWGVSLDGTFDWSSDSVVFCHLWRPSVWQNWSNPFKQESWYESLVIVESMIEATDD